MLSGSVLITVGLLRLKGATQGSQQLVQPALHAESITPPALLLVAGACVFLGAIPSLLFFSGCAQGPPQPKYASDVSTSRLGLHACKDRVHARA